MLEQEILRWLDVGKIANQIVKEISSQKVQYVEKLIKTTEVFKLLKSKKFLQILEEYKKFRNQSKKLTLAIEIIKYDLEGFQYNYQLMIKERRSYKKFSQYFKMLLSFLLKLIKKESRIMRKSIRIIYLKMIESLVDQMRRSHINLNMVGMQDLFTRNQHQL